MSTYHEIQGRLLPEMGKHLAVAIWSEDDVVGRALELRIEITAAEARDIIDEIDRKQDCTLGITWDTIDCYLDGIRHKRGDILNEDRKRQLDCAPGSGS